MKATIAGFNGFSLSVENVTKEELAWLIEKFQNGEVKISAEEGLEKDAPTEEEDVRLGIPIEDLLPYLSTRSSSILNLQLKLKTFGEILEFSKSLTFNNTIPKPIPTYTQY
jgi:hypothetical protein